MVRSLVLVPAVFIWMMLSLAPIESPAQTAAQAPPNQTTYTFRADTHIVLTDVEVTDKNGNPVHGLPQSAFRIFDNNKPQEIASFEEHSEMPAAMPLQASLSGVFSNDYLLHLPPVLNIILIDIANLGMADQMYLNLELTKFLNEQPEGQPLAVYLRAGSGCFLVQNFTSDHSLLLAALHKAIPRFSPPESQYLYDYDTLHQMALALSQLPGRKNVLWFSGGSTLFMLPDARSLQNDGDWRTLYDELDQERIAVYPIDARGLMVIFRPMETHMVWEQHLAMNDVARATGGQAFYDNNGLKEVTEHFLNTDVSFYALTYAPQNLRFDNKWHKIRVEVNDRSYQLHYRSGYFADGSVQNKEEPPKSRTRLLANGETLEMVEQRDRPIIFWASVLLSSDPGVAERDKPSGALPSPPSKKGTVPFSIRYTVPRDALTVKVVNGKHQVTFGVVAIALNSNGDPVAQDAEQVKMVFREESFLRHPDLPITLDQQVNLRKDDQFLNLGIWDTISGRFGTIEVPLEVHKPVKR